MCKLLSPLLFRISWNGMSTCSETLKWALLRVWGSSEGELPVGRASCMDWPAPRPASSEALTCCNRGCLRKNMPAPVFQSPGSALPFFIYSHHCHCYNCQKLGVLDIGHSREEDKRQNRSTSAWRCENRAWGEDVSNLGAPEPWSWMAAAS